jgi:hypothetical protein
MDWSTDAFFAIGKTHKVCQDYARAGRTPDGLPYAIVCDGCSSSPDTDFGARLLAAATERHMPAICRGDASFQERESKILSLAWDAATAVSVPARALDATLIAAYPREYAGMGKVGVAVSMRGDGVIVSRTREGKFMVDVIDHLENAPRYLNYDLDGDRLAGYLRRFGDESVSKYYHSGLGRDDDGKWLGNSPTMFEGHPRDWFFPAFDFDLVMVLSDGVQTFQRVVRTGTSKSLEDVPVEDVVEQLIKIKGTKGEFVTRRCQKFLNKFCVENEWQHADDFSVAAIWMDEPE